MTFARRSAVAALCLASLTPLQAQLLRESGDGFAFMHDLVRSAIVDGIGADRQRLLHRQLALAAEQLRAHTPRDRAPSSASIAEHWELGGEPARAVPHRLAAAKAAGLTLTKRETAETESPFDASATQGVEPRRSAAAAPQEPLAAAPDPAAEGAKSGAVRDKIVPLAETARKLFNWRS